jgi:hypothetical protein
MISKTNKFVSTKESEVGDNKGEKPIREKPNEQPHPKPKPKPVQFHCDYCGRDCHKGELCFKRKRQERRTSTTPPMVYLSLICRCPGPRRL